MAPEIAVADADVSAAQPHLIVKLSAAAYALAGVFVALSGLQLVGLRFYDSLLAPLPYVLMLGGVSLLYLATRVYRARTWAAITALVLAPALLVILVGWVAYSITAVFSCMVLLAFSLLGLSAVLGGVALSWVRRAAQARARLDAAGMSLGL